MSDKIENNKVIQLSTWKNRSWCKRQNEPTDAYVVFMDYLEDDELRSKTWIGSLDKERIKTFPPKFRTKKALNQASVKWRWEIRKNDYLNQVYDVARKAEQEKLENFSASFGEGFAYLKAVWVRSLQKKWEEGYEMSMDEILRLASKIADIQMHLSDKEERRKHRINIDNLPTTKIKEILATVSDDILDIEPEEDCES